MPYKNAEKRKAKSRDAARSRRGKEADVFAELSSLIPVPAATVATMDKSSVMRIAISHLKIRTLMNGLDDLDTEPQHTIDNQYLKTLNGFLMIMDKDGDLVYISENIVKHLGLTQIDMIGQNIYEYSHPCDHEEIHEVLDEKHTEDNKDNVFHTEKTFFARMKCTLTSKGRNVNLKSATYKVIRFRGHRHMNEYLNCWVWICESIPHPSHMDLPLDSCTFVTRHSLDMKFCYCEDRVKNLLGYDSKALVNRSLFEFHHALDGEYMDKIYKDLHSKGQVWTDHYRFLAKGGGYAWMETQATVVHNAKTERPQYILCVHFVLSDIEEPDTILSEVQQADGQRVPTDLTVPHKTSIPVPKGPIPSTETIFVPRTKAMDKGICAPKRKLKEEADIEMGLIAPTAGDEITPVKFDAQDSEMVALLKDVLIQAMDLENKAEQPFFMTVEEEHKDSDIRENAPEIPNLEHLADKPYDTGHQAKQTRFFDTDDIDYEMRAPYIPMSGEEDLLFQVVQPVPLFDENYSVPVHMLGTTESVFSPMPEDPNTTNKNLPVPMAIRRQEAMQKQEKLYREMEHKKVTLKVRQPVETNRLETGPPAYKKIRLEEQEEDSSDWDSDTSPVDLPLPKPTTRYTDINSIKGSNVLKNLLLTGHDSSGYNIEKYDKPQKKLLAENSTLRGLLTGPIDYTPPTSPPKGAYNAFQVSALPKPIKVVAPKLTTTGPASQQEFRPVSSVAGPSPPLQSAKITIKTLTNAGQDAKQQQEQILLTDEMLQMLLNFRQGKLVL